MVDCLKKPSAGCSGSGHYRNADWIPGPVQWLKDTVLVYLWLLFKLECAVCMAITLNFFFPQGNFISGVSDNGHIERS